MPLLRSREVLAALLIFALALALRLLTLAEVHALPSFSHLLIDAVAYDAWAQRIAAGDWIGDSAFYQAPFYPYFAAVVYKLTGGDHETLRTVQAGLGALSCVLVFATGRVLFGFGAGVVAGVLLALFPPALFFDTIVQKTSLGLALTTGLLLALATLQARARAAAALAAGMLLGLLALTRENALVFLPIVLLWIPWRFREQGWRRVAALGLALAVGLAATLGPVVLRNRWIGDTWSLTTSQLGTNFWYGNGPDANGMYVPLVPGRHTPEFESPDSRRIAERALGRDLTAGEVSAYWLDRTLAHIRADPARWLSLMVWKGLLVWNAVEIPDTEDVYLHAEWSRLIRWTLPWLHFGVLAPLGLAGLAFALRTPRTRRDAMLFVALGVAYSAGVAAFLVLARFRFPLVPMLLPFVGLLAVRGGTLARARDWRSLAMPLGVAALAAVVINLPLLDRDALSASGHMNLAVIAFEQNDLDAAESHLLRAAAFFDDDPDLQLQLGVLRERQGRLVEAERHARRALALEADDHRSHRLLARILRETGRPEQARRQQRRARQLDPDVERRPAPERDVPPSG